MLIMADTRYLAFWVFHFDGKSSRFPFGVAILQSPGPVTFFPQSGHSVEGQYTVRAAAIGNNFQLRIKLIKMFLQL